MAERINSEKRKAPAPEEESSSQTKLKQELEGLQNRIATKEASYVELETRLADNEKELHRLTVENSSTELKNKELEQSLNKLNTENERMKKDCDKLKQSAALVDQSLREQ